MRGGKACLGDQQAARRVLVDPVHKPWLLALGIAHHLQHLIDVSRRAGAALHRKPERLVQHENIVVLVDRHLLQRGKRLLRAFRQFAHRLRRVELQRRNADALPLLQPVLAVDALAVDAQLALTDDALDVRERQAGKARFEKAIDAHVVLVGRHFDGLHLVGSSTLTGFAAAGLPLQPWAHAVRRARLQNVASSQAAFRPAAAQLSSRSSPWTDANRRAHHANGALGSFS